MVAEEVAIPSHPNISGYLERAVRRWELEPPARILDLASGGGRHARWLASNGHDVTALDIDAPRLTQWPKAPIDHGRICTLVADANRDLPFRRESFDAVVVVHFVSPALIERISRVLRPHGYLVFETFGGQGENWRTLPAEGAIREALGLDFEVLDYRERRVGPAETRSVGVKFFARRK